MYEEPTLNKLENFKMMAILTLFWTFWPYFRDFKDAILRPSVKETRLGRVWEATQ